MSKFVLTAQLKLQAPKNTQQVVNQIKSQLSGVSVNVNVKGATQAQRQIKQITAATNQATSAAHNMGKTFGVALKRFAAFTIASRAVSLFTNSLAGAVQESIDFQREIIKIAQVTGKTTKELKGLSDEISRLSVTLGTSSTDLVAVTRILAQAGIQAGDLKVALEALAKTTLAPTFEDINKTAEGAVAILAQFGKGVGELERQLGAINAVAGQFAVESGDLIGAIRRTGGVFKAAGGSLEEFLGLFTSIRATTRESSESIATGLRTILTRIQRPATIQYLKELGVSLTDLNGRFVGPFEAVKRLSKALADVPAGDLKFIQIAEQLGGFRQIGKVIPLLQQFETAERARQAAIAGGDSLTRDAATAQQALAVQIVKVKEEFLALVRGITESTSFQVMAKTALGLASALIKVADALKPIIPLLGAFAAVKVSQGIGGFAAGIGASLRGVKAKHQGGKIHHFARGGFVPGSGNRDTVPAMLQPGEFVIRKSSVKKIGADQLQAMNQNKYAAGGIIALRPYDKDPPNKPLEAKGSVTLKDVAGKAGFSADAKGVKKIRENAQVLQSAKRSFSPEFQQLLAKRGSLSVTSRGMAIGDQTVGDKTEAAIKDSFLQAINASGDSLKTYFSGLSGEGKVTGRDLSLTDLDKLGIEGVIGNAFEALLVKIGAPFDSGSQDARQRAKTKSDNNSAFDFPSGLGSLARGKFSEFASIPIDAKRTLNKSYVDEVINKKYPNLLAEEYKLFKSLKGQETLAAKSSEINAIYAKSKQVDVADSAVAKLTGLSKSEVGKRRKAGEFGRTRRASGGGISGSDTVPALLTPGEFVVNKKSARSIGYANLNRMNKKGVTGFAAGGPVGVQKFAKGGAAGGGGGFGGMEKMMLMSGFAATALSNFGDKSKEATDAQFVSAVAAERVSQSLIQLAIIIQASMLLTKKLKEWGKALEKSAKDVKKDKKKKDKKPKLEKALEEAEGKKKKKKKKTEKKAEAEASSEAEDTKKSSSKKKKDKKKADKATSESATEETKTKKEEEKTEKSKKKGKKKKKKVSDARNVSELAKEKAVQKGEKDLANKGKEMKEDRNEKRRLHKKRNRLEKQVAVDEGDRTEANKRKRAATKTAAAATGVAATEETRLAQKKAKAAKDQAGADDATRHRKQMEKGWEPGGKKAEAVNRKKAEIRAHRKQLEDRGITRKRRKGDGAFIHTKKGVSGGVKSAGWEKQLRKLQDELKNAERRQKSYNKNREGAVRTEKAAILAAKNSADASKKQAVVTKAAAEEKAKALRKEAAAVKDSRDANNRYVNTQKRLKTTQNDLGQANKKLAGSQNNLRTSAKKLAMTRNKEAKHYHPAVKHARAYGRELNRELIAKRKALKGTKGYRYGLKLLSIGFTKGKQKLNGFRKQLKILPKDANKAARALKKMNAQMRKTKGGGMMSRMKGRVGKGMSRGATAIGGAAGLAMSAAMISGQVFGALAEIAGRKAEKAKDKGDVTGAGKAGQERAMNEAFSEMFTMQGIIRALTTDPKELRDQIHQQVVTQAATDATEAAVGKQSKFIEEAKTGKTVEGRASEFVGAGGVKVEKLGESVLRSSTEAMGFINRMDEGQAKTEKLNALKKQELEAAAIMGKNATSINQLTKFFDEFGGATAAGAEAQKAAAVAAFKMKAAMEAVAKANFDNLKVMSVFAASSNAVNNFLSSLETGSLALESTIATIETAQANMGMGEEGERALNDAREQVLASVGGGENSSVGQAVNRSFDRAQGVNQFMGSLQKRISGLDINQSSEAAAKSSLETSLLAGVTDKATQEAIMGAVQSLGDIRGRDASSLIEEIKSGLDPLRKTALESAKAVLEHQKTIVALTKARRASELAYIEAQKKAIDVQLQAAKIFEDFGGDKLSSEQKEQARVAQFNLVAQDAGIKTLRNASAGELARAREEVAAKTDVQMARKASGGFQGPGGIDEDRTTELAKTNDALMALTRQRIDQIKEEIAIIAKKNAAEKSSFEKLMAGDIEGFIEQQAAAGAAAALRAGDANMASLFSPSALGAGMKSLEGTGMSDAEMQRAAGITLSTMGITDARSAGVMVGRDAETEALRAEGRGLASELGAQAQQMAEIKKMEVAKATVTITNAQVVFDETMQRKVASQTAADRGVGELAGMYRGGVVYANRGIFVPRGTDTVPAMLTPGEFVVNRAAVNRGNNLQILRAMNSSGRQDATAPATAMSAGGPVGYYQFGDLVQKMGSMFGDAMPALGTAVTSFANAIDKLTGFTMGVDINSMPPISVNVVLPKLEPAIRDIVLDAVRDEIPKYKATNNGLKKIAGMGE